MVIANGLFLVGWIKWRLCMYLISKGEGFPMVTNFCSPKWQSVHMTQILAIGRYLEVLAPAYGTGQVC